KHEVVIILNPARLKAVDVNRRGDDGRFAAVNLPDPLGDAARVGDVMVRLLCGAQVPPAQAGEHGGKRKPRERSETFARRVIVIAPHPAHRRVAITDVNGPFTAMPSLAVTGAAAQDEAVIRQVEALDRERVEKEVLAEFTPDRWQVLHPGSVNRRVAQTRRNPLRYSHSCVERRPGE